jgi:hypothetical protein
VDKETANYIISYFSNLLTVAERMAIKHTSSVYKLGDVISDNSSLTRVYKKKGWLTSDQTVLDLLKGGYEQFELNVANRILAQSADKVYFNNCPNCNKLARTPFAKQCRHCNHSWHNLIVGQFRLKNCFQLESRQFYLLGEITKGEIKQGHFMDLRKLGLNKKPKIESIEFALTKEKNHNCEDIGLGTSELTEDDKTYLKSLVSFTRTFEIVSN